MLDARVVERRIGKKQAQRVPAGGNVFEHWQASRRPGCWGRAPALEPGAVRAKERRSVKVLAGAAILVPWLLYLHGPDAVA